MSSPSDTILVKFSEEVAQYADLRPVRRQPMTLAELVGLILTSTGKHPERVQEKLRGGTCTYNVYRYWWEGAEISSQALADILAAFPDPDPSRPFSAAACLWVRLLNPGEPAGHSLTLEKQEAARRRWLRRESPWDILMNLAEKKQPELDTAVLSVVSAHQLLFGLGQVKGQAIALGEDAGQKDQKRQRMIDDVPSMIRLPCDQRLKIQ